MISISAPDANGVRGRVGRAFTLVELMTVLVILGILTLIALPLVGNASTSTGEAALRTNLASIRNAIELFANQHNGSFPSAVSDGTNAAGTEAAIVSHLTQYSNAAGAVSASKSATYPYGPYLKYGIPQVTAGPLKGSTGVSVTNSASALTADGSPTKGWKYSYVTGQLICNSTAVSSDGATTYAQY